MNEFDLIGKLTASLPQNPATVLGPGDDCAVLDLGLADRWVLFKTDAVVDGVHFTRQSPPEKVGHKALARCLSDVAAMGGQPVSALVTLGLPAGYDPDWVFRAYSGMKALAERYQVSLVGGETTTNPGGVLISIALLGLAAKTRCIRRAGARVGDAVFVTGELGGSLQGKHLDFEPRLTEAAWLVEHFDLHAMIDISDGLAGDLRHILKASGCGAELLASAIPISPAARLRPPDPARPGSPLTAALSDGEDFELLFTVASRDAVPLLDAWKARFPDVRLGCIGRIQAEPGLHLRTGQGRQPVTEHGYTHHA